MRSLNESSRIALRDSDPGDYDEDDEDEEENEDDRKEDEESEDDEDDDDDDDDGGETWYVEARDASAPQRDTSA
jgi:hypothetical protein